MGLSSAGILNADFQSLRDLDSQLEQFDVNYGHSPEWIGCCYLKNRVTDLRADRRPPGSLLPGLKSLEQLETLSMQPSMTGLGLTMISASCRLVQ
jgi:hypothetical protein